MMRKSALAVLAVVVLVTAALVWLLKDGLVEGTAEYALGMLLRTEVDFDDFSVDLTRLETRFGALRIADRRDKSRYLLETGAGRFDLEFEPLLQKKLVVSELAVKDIATQTPRAVSEPESPSEAKTTGGLDRAAASLAGLADHLPALNLEALGKRLEIDKLMKPDQLESVQALKDVRTDVGGVESRWDRQLEQSTFDEDLRRLKADIDALERPEVQGMEDAPRLKAAIEDLKELRGRARDLRDKARGRLDEAQRDFATLQQRIDQADQRMDADVARVLRLANLTQLDTQSMAALVFGPAVVDRLGRLLRYAALARSYLGHDEATKPRPPRRVGRDIPFPTTRAVPPALLIRTAQLTGTTPAEQRIAGTVKGITTDQSRYGAPTTLAFTIGAADGADWDLRGSLDHRQGKAEDAFELRGARVALGTIALKRAANSPLPGALIPEDNDVSVRIRLQGDSVDADLRLDAGRVGFQFPDPTSLPQDQRAVLASLRQLFAGFDHVTLKAALSGKAANPALRLSSNIDSAVSQRLNALVGEKLKQTEAAARRSIAELAGGQREQAAALLGERRAPIETALRKDVDAAEAVENELAKRQQALQQRLTNAAKERVEEEKQQLKEDLQKKGKDLFKGLGR